MNYLICSSATKEGLLKCIEDFYCGTKMFLLPDGTVKRVVDQRVLSNVRWVKKGKRFRYESIN